MKRALEFFDVESLPWEPIEGQAGLSERILAGSRDSHDHSRMLRFAPGTVTAETLTHPFWEEVWIIEGSIRDIRLNEVFTAGMYACRPPGMPHGPWESLHGCTTFEVRYSAP
jgi:hypothetical protein